MRSCRNFVVAASLVLLLATESPAEIRTVVERNGQDTATAAFKFNNVPVPSNRDGATNAKFTIITGRRDRNGGDVETLRDDRVPRGNDRPSENFFFAAGTEGGRLLVDLGDVTDVQKVNTY